MRELCGCTSWNYLEGTHASLHESGSTQSAARKLFGNGGIIRYIKNWFHLLVLNNLSNAIDGDRFVGRVISLDLSDGFFRWNGCAHFTVPFSSLIVCLLASCNVNFTVRPEGIT